MPQIIVAQNMNGVVLAVENWAVRLDEEGRETDFQVNRLLPLASHCGLLSSGAAEGIEMAKGLKQFLLGERLTDVQDVYGAALPFLSTEYERFMRKKCELLPLDPIYHVSFILAGRTEKDAAMPFRLYFFWTKKKLPYLDGDEISSAFTLPRRMGIEFQLNRVSRGKGSIREMLEMVKAGMKHLSDRGEVRPPVGYAMITLEGYQPVNP